MSIEQRYFSVIAETWGPPPNYRYDGGTQDGDKYATEAKAKEAIEKRVKEMGDEYGTKTSVRNLRINAIERWCIEVSDRSVVIFWIQDDRKPSPEKDVDMVANYLKTL